MNDGYAFVWFKYNSSWGKKKKNGAEHFVTLAQPPSHHEMQTRNWVQEGVQSKQTFENCVSCTTTWASSYWALQSVQIHHVPPFQRAATQNRSALTFTYTSSRAEWYDSELLSRYGMLNKIKYSLNKYCTTCEVNQLLLLAILNIQM